MTSQDADMAEAPVRNRDNGSVPQGLAQEDGSMQIDPPTVSVSSHALKRRASGPDSDEIGDSIAHLEGDGDDGSSSEEDDDSEGDDVFDAITLMELASQHQKSGHTKHVKFEDMPIDMLRRGDPRVYRRGYESVHGEFRGEDRPILVGKKGSQADRKHRMANPTNKVGALITAFHEHTTEGPPTSSYGVIWKSETAHRVKIRLNAHPHIPNLEIYVKRRSDGPEAKMTIFVNSIRKTDGDVTGFRMASAVHQPGFLLVGEDAKRPQVKTQLDNLRASNALMQVELTLTDEDTPDGANDLGPRFAKPLWTGIDPVELGDIRDRFLGVIKGEDLTEGEMLIANLLVNKRFLIHRSWHGEPATAEAICLFMEQSIQIAGRFNNFWFYQLQAQHKRLIHLGLQHEKFEFPRWAVREFIPEYNSKGEMIAAQPFSVSPAIVGNDFPDVETAINAYRLGLMRGNDIMAPAIQHNLDQQARAMLMYITEDKKARGNYRLDIDCSLKGVGGNKDAMRPAEGTSVVITTINGTRFKGQICPQFWYKEFNLCAYVKLQGRLQDSLEGAAIIDELKLTSDITSVNRQHGALKEALVGPRREEGDSGPDFMHYLLRVPKNHANHNPWAKFVANAEGPVRETFLGFARNFGLNAKQMEFIEMFSENQTGISSLIGPPGTGKSVDIVALMYSFLQLARAGGAKHPVMFSAPSNTSTENGLRKMLSVRPDAMGFKLVRFKGGKQPKMERPEDLDEDAANERAVDDALWDLVGRNTGKIRSEDAMADYLFQTQFRKEVEAISADAGHQHNFTAKRFIYLKQELGKGYKGAYKTHEMTQAAKEDLENQEDILLGHFWAGVDVVFVTLNTAAHEQLRHWFKPRLVVFDEAAMATFPDLMTAVVSSWNSIWCTVFSGDPDQIHGRAPGEGRNELSPLFKDSLLSRFKNDASTGLPHVQLIEQYRMIPEIANTISTVFYKGRLVSHGSVQGPKAESIAAQQFFKRFGAAYEGWNVVGIDFSGEKNESKLYHDGTSLMNLGEAKSIVDLVEEMVAFGGFGPGGRRLRLDDFLILTPYSGQEKLLYVEFSGRQLMDDVNNRPRIYTTNSVQGEEGNIQIISMCTNRKARPMGIKFIAQKHHLNVALSRAKYFQVIFANFKPWMEALMNGTYRHFIWESSNKKHFGDMLSTLTLPAGGACKYKIISQNDFARGMAGDQVTVSDMNTCVVVKRRKQMRTAQDEWDAKTHQGDRDHLAKKVRVDNRPLQLEVQPQSHPQPPPQPGDAAARPVQGSNDGSGPGREGTGQPKRERRDRGRRNKRTKDSRAQRGNHGRGGGRGGPGNGRGVTSY